MILLFTRHNAASANIAKMLIEKHGFGSIGANEWNRDDTRLVDTEAPTVLDVPADFTTDCILVLSSHRSKAPGNVLTAHVPGNWANADMGGKPKTLNVAAAGKLKILLQELKREGDRIGWPVTLEADHHGPTCDVPILFVEIGNGETEWTNADAAEAVANAVVRFLERDAKGETFETVFGVGGGHYSKFTKLVLESDIAVGHIAPKYVLDGMDDEMFRQAIGRNVENVAKVLVLKDETSAKQRQKIAEMAAGLGLSVGEI